MNPNEFILENIKRMKAYVPGLQLNDPDIIKLNTNENPFPISNKIKEALISEIEKLHLHKYPDPLSQKLRDKISEIYKTTPKNIVIGNGSDEILSFVFRSILDSTRTIIAPNPSYSLYPVLAASLGANFISVNLTSDWKVDFPSMLHNISKQITPLTVITNPNSPTGICEHKTEILKFADQNPGLTLIDEAYVDFGGESIAEYAGTKKYPRLMSCNTFSKAYSLAGQRIGWLIADESIISEIDKIRDSYNVSRLAQTAALAALQDMEEIKRRIKIICETRDWLINELNKLNFYTLPSSSNFIFTSPPKLSLNQSIDEAKIFYDYLLQNKVLIRYFPVDKLREFVRISIGTKKEMERLVELIHKFINLQKTG